MESKTDRKFSTVMAFFERGQVKMYSRAFDLWDEIVKSEGFELRPEHFQFIFTHLLPTIFSKDAVLRRDAIRCIRMTQPLLQKSDYRGHNAYKTFVEKSIVKYMPNLKTEIETNPDWPFIWCAVLSIIQKDMVRSIQINAFLSVAEAGFRSNVCEIRVKSFHCWRHLIEIFAAEGQLAAIKRLKLITVPLTATASKNLDLAKAKFGCWINLIRNISTDMCEDPNMCFVHFLSFCFGPLGDQPLGSYVKSLSSVSPGKLYTEMRLPVVIALIKLLGRTDPLVDTLPLDITLEQPKLDIAKVYLKCRREIIHSCAEATVLIYNVYNLTVDKQAALTKNLWVNLFALMKQDDKLMKSMLMLTESLKAIATLSNDRERSGLRDSLPIILDALVAADFNLRNGDSMQSSFALYMLDVLNVMMTVMEQNKLEMFFIHLVSSQFDSLTLTDSKVGFVTGFSPLLKSADKCSYLIWKLFWTKVIVKMDKPHSFQMAFLQFGLENYFNGMTQIKDLWIFNWTIMERNVYLNQVAELFHKQTVDKPSSSGIVEVVTRMMDTVDQMFDKTSVPLNVFKLFNMQLDRFLSTEFLDKFIESFNHLLMKLTGEQFLLLLTDINDTLKLVRRCSSKSTKVTKVFNSLRKLLRDKCALIEPNKTEKWKAFLAHNRDWIDASKTPANTNKFQSPNVHERKTESPKPLSQKNASNDFIPISREWTFNPKDLTEHQIERMKERRDDIPALYNDNSQSQDSRSLQPWNAKQGIPTKGSAPSTVIMSLSEVIKSAGKDNSIKNSDESSTNKRSQHVDIPVVLTKENGSFSENRPRRNRKLDAELSRLAIDTVEGSSVFTDQKKTRHSRRHSVDTRMRESPVHELRTSPRKSGQEGKKSEKPSEISKKDRRITLPAAAAMAIESKPKEKTVQDPIVEKSVAQESVIVEVQTENQSIPLTETTTFEPRPEATDGSKSTPAISSNSVNVEPSEKITPPMVSIPNDFVESGKSEKIPSPTPTQPAEEKVAATETMTKILPPLVAITDEKMETEGDEVMEHSQEKINLALESGNHSENLARSIVSSPELENVEERESTFLNDTINISPILKEAIISKVSGNVATNSVPAVVKEVTKAIETINNNAKNEILTTPKRSMEPAPTKENTPVGISTTPHSFLSKMNGRGAQMLQQTKLFQESTPKEKPKEESMTALSKEETVQRMLIKTAIPPRNSPSTSILRRKRLEDSMDETLESPAAKKKKVSFSDPPVSATKEFERDSNNKMSRQLHLKSKLARFYRIDSAADLNDRGDQNSDSDNDMEELIEAPRRGPTYPTTVVDETKYFEGIRQKYSEPVENGVVPPKMTSSQMGLLTEILLHGIAKDEAHKEQFFRTLTMALPDDALHWPLKENSGYYVMTQVKKEIPTAVFNNFIFNQLKTDKDFAAQLSRDMKLRMDPIQKVEFIASLCSSDTSVSADVKKD